MSTLTTTPAPLTIKNNHVFQEEAWGIVGALIRLDIDETSVKLPMDIISTLTNLQHYQELPHPPIGFIVDTLGNQYVLPATNMLLKSEIGCQ